jgi:hypothetical protein
MAKLGIKVLAEGLYREISAWCIGISSFRTYTMHSTGMEVVECRSGQCSTVNKTCFFTKSRGDYRCLQTEFLHIVGERSFECDDIPSPVE